MLSADETYILATLEPSEQLNQATPHGRYHTCNNGEDDLDHDDLNFDLHSEGVSTVGSTETIPSLWEPALTPDSSDLPVISQQNPCLIRSQSLITLNALRDSPSRSCPNLSTTIIGGIHRHRHVFLSHFRRSATNEPGNIICLNSTELEMFLNLSMFYPISCYKRGRTPFGIQ
jgi:hypothetical protein